MATTVDSMAGRERRQTSLRVLIAEDEPLTRLQLTRLCERRPDLRIVAQADSGASAIAALRTHKPHVVLLGSEFKDMSGFEVLRSFDPKEQPFAIMIASHASHVARTLEHNVVSYLTKPVDAARFSTAVECVHTRRMNAFAHLRAEEFGELLAALNATVASIPRVRRLAAEKGRRLYLLDLIDIEYIECDGNYVSIHARNERYIARHTIGRLTVLLAPAGFVRIERSALLNLNNVAFAERTGKASFAFTLRSGRCVVSSPSYRRTILAELRKGFDIDSL